MSIDPQFELRRYEFNGSIANSLNTLEYARDLWPVVYVLSNETIKEAYVGETTDVISRMSTHLNSPKNKLSVFHLIAGKKFNKSATLDIECNLIKYISGDGMFKLMNGNIGLANHNYYQKGEVYRDIFESIWSKLRAEGIAVHSIEHINNSDLFKFSPYKSLTAEQTQSLLIILKNLLNENTKAIMGKGGAGTGKSVLTTFLFKLLNTDFADLNYKEFGDAEADFIETVRLLKIKYPNPKMALVVPMKSFRSTLKKVFKNVKGLKASMVVAPSEITWEKFDIIVVDEAHRLRRRENLTNYEVFDDACRRLGMDESTATELDWMLNQSGKTVLFYDNKQTIKPSDVKPEDFEILGKSPFTISFQLNNQMRVKGGKDYERFINNLLDINLAGDAKKFISPHYDFRLFTSLETMIKEIREHNAKYGLSRLIAGYAWKWVSKNDESLYDIIIDDLQLRWNTTGEDWINSPDAAFEVGCIHTTQGYDLNYTGIIFGNEITYDNTQNKIVIIKKNYFDRNGKASIKDPEELKTYITNIYKTILLRGIRGTFVYACDPSLREYLSQYIPGAESDMKAIITKDIDETVVQHTVPLYRLDAAAGDFSDQQKVEGFTHVPLPEHTRFSTDLFACKVVGESMNKVIPNSSICLFRKDSGGSRNGKIVLVQHTSIQDSDFGSGYTVKEYHSTKDIGDDDWSHKTINLLPMSNDPSYKPINITPDAVNDLKVIGIFEKVLYID